MNPTPARPDDADRTALRERKRMLDALWFVIAFVALAVIGVPWFLRFVNLNLAPAVWAVFAFSLLHLAQSTWLAAPLEHHLATVSRLVHWSGIVFLAAVWHLAGGVGNPAFLLVFALPVAAGRLLGPRSHPYWSAGLASLAVSLVAFGESQELRWYTALLVPGLGPPLNWVPDLADRQILGEPPEAGVLVLWLLTFGVLSMALAVIVDSLDTHLFGAFRRSEKAERDLRRAEELWREILDAQPEPAALVFSDTGQLIETNSAFRLQFGVQPDDRRPLDQFLGLEDPQPLTEALRNPGAETHCERASDQGARYLKIQSRRVGESGSNTSVVFLRDLTEDLLLRKAAESGADPLILLDQEGRVAFFNAAAEDIVEGLFLRVPVEDLFGSQRAGAHWWEPGPSGEARRRLRLKQGLFEAAVEGFAFHNGRTRFLSLHLNGPLPEPAAVAARRLQSA